MSRSFHELYESIKTKRINENIDKFSLILADSEVNFKEYFNEFVVPLVTTGYYQDEEELSQILLNDAEQNVPSGASGMSSRSERFLANRKASSMAPVAAPSTSQKTSSVVVPPKPVEEPAIDPKFDELQKANAEFDKAHEAYMKSQAYAKLQALQNANNTPSSSVVTPPTPSSVVAASPNLPKSNDPANPNSAPVKSSSPTPAKTPDPVATPTPPTPTATTPETYTPETAKAKARELIMASPQFQNKEIDFKKKVHINDAVLRKILGGTLHDYLSDNDSLKTNGSITNIINLAPPKSSSVVAPKPTIADPVPSSDTPTAEPKKRRGRPAKPTGLDRTEPIKATEASPQVSTSQPQTDPVDSKSQFSAFNTSKPKATASPSNSGNFGPPPQFTANQFSAFKQSAPQPQTNAIDPKQQFGAFKNYVSPNAPAFSKPDPTSTTSGNVTPPRNSAPPPRTPTPPPPPPASNTPVDRRMPKIQQKIAAVKTQFTQGLTKVAQNLLADPNHKNPMDFSIINGLLGKINPKIAEYQPKVNIHDKGSEQGMKLRNDFKAYHDNIEFLNKQQATSNKQQQHPFISDEFRADPVVPPAKAQARSRIYEYEALDQTGNVIKSTITAPNEEAANEMLIRQGLFVTNKLVQKR